MGRRPFQEYDPDDPSTWYDGPIPPAPWDEPQQDDSWLGNVASYIPQVLGGLTSGLMQLPAMESMQTPVAPAPMQQPAGPSPEQDLATMRMYNARKVYERQFGSPGSWGSASSVTSNPQQVLARLQQARMAGWRPGGY